MAADEEFERELQLKRSRIIQLMRIERVRGSTLFAPRPLPPAQPDQRRLRVLRLKLTESFGPEDPEEVEALLEDLRTLLARCGLHLRAQALQRKEVKKRSKADRSRATARATRRGRQFGAVYFAARQLGLGLAMIWAEQTGRPPTRTVDVTTGCERGAYFDFVALVLSVIPARLLAKGKGQPPRPDSLVRQSIEDYVAARSSPEEYRRRGLIDESYWFHGKSSPAEKPPRAN